MLIGNCSLLARADGAGGLALPWPRVEGHEQPTLAISVRDAQSVRAEYLAWAPIVRTEVHAPSGALEVLDFAPRVAADGRIVRPAACIRIVRPLAGRPEVLATVAAPGLERAELGDGLELRARDATPVRLLGELAERAARGVPFFLSAPCAALAVQGSSPTLLSGPVLAMAEDCLLRTRAAWRDFVLGLRLPLEPQQATLRAAIAIKLHEDESAGGFAECDDPRSLLHALDRLGCAVELARFCRADGRPAAAARRALDARGPDAAAAARELVAAALRQPVPGPESAASLEHWAALRGAWLAALSIDAERDAEALRAALAGARAVLEIGLFDERRGFVRKAPAATAVDLDSARLVTSGFFGPKDPRAATHLDALAAAIAHDLAASSRQRCELAHAQALAGRREEARRSLAEVVSGGGPGDGLGANVAFVLAAFACSREWP